MRIRWLLIVLVCLFIPSCALAADTGERLDTIKNFSELQRMTDTYLGQVIFSEDQVDIQSQVKNDDLNLYSTSNSALDEKSLKEIVEKYNKSVFLGILGHEVEVDPAITNDNELLQELNSRQKYLVQAYAGGKAFSSYTFDLIYDQINVDNNVAKIIATRDITFQTNLEKKQQIVDTSLCQQEGYIFKKSDNEWKLINVIFDTQGIQNSAINSLLENDNPDDWLEKFDFANLKRDQYEDTKTFTDMVNESGEIDLNKYISPETEYSKAYDNLSLEDSEISLLSSYTYSKAKVDNYANRWGDSPNPEYRYFGTNGDCTNFVSQAMHYGGMPMSNYWYYYGRNDYSRTWTITEDLRDYIMNYTLSVGYYQQLPSYPAGVGYEGTVIQFSDGASWIHSAIVREYENGNLYVAEHSGRQGDKAYVLKPTDFSNVRSFWIAKG